MAVKILEMRGISKAFGQTQALRNIRFDLEFGEVHALLGENGAGKSTLIKILGGIHQPDSGDIVLDGEKVIVQNVQNARKYGITLVHQEIVNVPYLSVAENIFLGREPTTRLRMKDSERIYREAEEMIAKLGLDLDVRQPLGELSIAHQQMIELVKAVSFNARIIVMDEPTSSLSDEEVERLFEVIERLRKDKVSIIYISHRLDEIFRISDRVTVIRDGEYIGTRKTSETNADELVSMMVGRTLETFYTRTCSVTDQEILRVDGLSKNGEFENVTFSVKKGEILGFYGLVGAGRSEIMTALFGASRLDSGAIYLDGERVQIKNPLDAIEKGIAMVPEDRKKEGLVLANSVCFNITLSCLKELMVKFLLNECRKEEVAEKYVQVLSIKTPSVSTPVSSLSGGNQQKVVLGKWLSTRPRVLILDEPTRGVDVGAKSEIYGIINQLAKDGIAIIMVSSDLPEIINMCDSVCVVRNGRIVTRLPKEKMTQENIIKYATGVEEGQ
jgi:ABC-type sugar transport system ATPase subunit